MYADETISDRAANARRAPTTATNGDRTNDYCFDGRRWSENLSEFGTGEDFL